MKRHIYLAFLGLVLFSVEGTAQVRAYNAIDFGGVVGGDARDWINNVGTGWQVYAFEQDFPQPPDAQGCLSAQNRVDINLPGGGLMIMRLPNDCPVVDGTSAGPFADGRIPNGGNLTLTFLPPIRAFYSYVGSVAANTTVGMDLLDENGVSFGRVVSRDGPGSAASYGIGFTSTRPVSTIVIDSTELGLAQLGTFGGLLAGETPLETFGMSCPADDSYPSGALCDLAYAYELQPLREIEQDVRLWDVMTNHMTSYAFEADFPRPSPDPPPLGCLSGSGSVTVALGAGQVTLRRSDDLCPVVAAASGAAADALIPQGESLTLTFSPPVRAFYGYYGSLNFGDRVSMSLTDSSGRQIGVFSTEPSSDNVAAVGHGFVSPTPVETVKLVSSETGPTVFGAFLGQADEPTFEGQGIRCSADGSYPAGAFCDFAVAFDTQIDQILTASDARQGHRFGWSVALEGDRALMGGNSAGVLDGNSVGQAYIFERNAQGRWLEVAKLVPDDTGPVEEFGCSVALEANRALVGACDGGGDRSGSAYIFERAPNGSWAQVATLKAADAAAEDFFGAAVALQGQQAVIGAPRDFDLGVQSGSVYLFEEQANGTWLQVSKIIPAAAGTGDLVGGALALDGDWLLIGGRDAAFVYQRLPTGQWSEVQKLTSDGTDMLDGFAQSLALSGARALIGAPSDDFETTNDNAGSVYVFERQANSQWIRSTKLRAGTRNSRFGDSVSLSGERALVGAFSHPFRSAAGSAYVFERQTDGGWQEIVQLTGNLTRLRLASGGRFGRPSLSLDGDRAMIGAWGELGTGDTSGAAYFFENLQHEDRSSLFRNGFELETLRFQ